MTVTVAQVSNTSTFLLWLTSTNLLANAMTYSAVTVNSNTAVGNAAIQGTFTSNVVSTGQLSLSNSSVTANVNIPTSAQVTSGQYFLSSNGSWVVQPIINSSVNTTGAVATLMDSWAMASYSVSEYLINVNDNIANNHYSSRILTTHDNTLAYITEYAQLTTNTAVGVFTSNTNGSNVQLYFTPVSTSTTVKLSRNII